MLAENLSFAAIDRASGALVGCMIVTDFHKSLTPAPNASDALAPIDALTQALATRYLALRAIAPGEVILVDMAAIADGYAGRGLYQSLRRACHAHAKAQGFTRVVGELSSAATQHVVLNKLGHQKLAEIKYREFEFRGEYPFASITAPECIVLAEGLL